MMEDRGKSDRSVVPEKPPNNADNHAAEVVEGRDRAKGNSPKRDKPWTLSQEGLPSALERVGQAARQERKQKFTALLHHIYDVGRLRRAYMAIEHEAAAGIDGETWRHYGENLKGNLEDLSARLARGAYRARPVRRAYIEKADGRKRPLGVAVLEDKGKPETFNFLGFTHYCGINGNGKFTVIRKTMRLRMLKKLKEVTVELRRRRHDSVEEQGRYVQALIRGHVQYYGVPLNSRAIGVFRYQVIRLWQKWLSRRSNRAYVAWDRMQRYIARWVPPAVICHPYPSVRFGG